MERNIVTNVNFRNEQLRFGCKREAGYVKLISMRKQAFIKTNQMHVIYTYNNSTHIYTHNSTHIYTHNNSTHIIIVHIYTHNNSTHTTSTCFGKGMPPAGSTEYMYQAKHLIHLTTHYLQNSEFVISCR